METRLQIRREHADALSEYGQVSIAFTVSSRLRFDGPEPVEEAVDPPWVKDYDAIRGEGPTRWAKRFDLTNWVVLSAFLGPLRVGGAVVAWNTDGVDMLARTSHGGVRRIGCNAWPSWDCGRQNVADERTDCFEEAGADAAQGRPTTRRHPISEED